LRIALLYKPERETPHHILQVSHGSVGLAIPGHYCKWHLK